MNVSRVLGADGARLHPRDAELLLSEEDGHRSHEVSAHLFDATEHPEAQLVYRQAIDWMSKRLSYAPFFTRRIQRECFDLDYPYWVPVQVDLSQHVFVHEVDRPGWAPVGSYLAEVVERPVDLSKPPWELHVVTGISDVHDLPPKLVAVFLKIHHSAGDGLTVRDLTLRLYSNDPAAPTAEHRPTGQVSRVAMGARAVASVPGQLARFVRRVRRTAEAPGQIAADEAAGRLPAPVKHPATSLNRQFGGGMAVDFIMLDLDDIKVIRAAVQGATVNDVLLATVGGALRIYLGADGQPTSTPLVAKVPRSMRIAEGWGSDNQLVLLSVDLRADIDDPIDRLRMIVEAARAAKVRSDHPAVRKLATRKDATPALLMRLTAAIGQRVSADPDAPRVSHSMVSNIPFDGEGLAFCGAPHAAVLPNQPPIDGDLLRHFLCRGVGPQLTLNICASVSAVPDLDRYLELLRGSFEQLTSAID